MAARLVLKGAGTASKGIFRSVWFVAKIGSLFLFFMFVFWASIIASFQQHTPEPFLREVGRHIFLSTQELADQSLAVVQKGDIYDFTGGIWEGSLQVIEVFSNLILAIILVVSWIRVFAWLYAKSPFSFPGNDFANYFMAILIFLIFQVFAGLTYGAIAGGIHTFSDAVFVAEEPFRAFALLFKAIAIMISPISERLGVAMNSTAANSTSPAA